MKRSPILLTILMVITALTGMIFGIIIENKKQTSREPEIEISELQEYISWKTPEGIYIRTYILQMDTNNYLITTTSSGNITCTEIFPEAIDVD